MLRTRKYNADGLVANAQPVVFNPNNALQGYRVEDEDALEILRWTLEQQSKKKDDNEDDEPAQKIDTKKVVIIIGIAVVLALLIFKSK